MVAYAGCWLAEAYAAVNYFTLDDGPDSAAQQARQLPIGAAAAVALVVISLAAASYMRRRQLVLLALPGGLVGLELLLRHGVQSMLRASDGHPARRLRSLHPCCPATHPTRTRESPGS